MTPAHAHTLLRTYDAIICADCPLRVPTPPGQVPVGRAGMHSWKSTE